MVKVIVPFYKDTLNQWESEALANNMCVLAAYPVVFLKPEGLDLSAIARRYPRAEVMSVSDDWLGTRRGIAGYNEMMMSADFYALFADTEYILICHTDAWLFRDELAEWCHAGYDHVAAPWPLRPRYQHFPLKQWLALKHRFCTPVHGISRLQMYGRIGNGGLSLRRVSAFREACVRHAAEIDGFNRLTDTMHNEDIFWALVPTELKVPAVEEALRFAFDLKPRVCWRLNGRQLPMGCHGYRHKSRVGFWRKFIPGI